jgi:hypothetical protein
MEIDCKALVRSVAVTVVECHLHSHIGYNPNSAHTSEIVDEVCAAYVWGSLDYTFAILAALAPDEKLYDNERGIWIYLTRGKAMGVLRKQVMGNIWDLSLTEDKKYCPKNSTDSLWFGLAGPLFRIHPKNKGPASGLVACDVQDNSLTLRILSETYMVTGRIVKEDDINPSAYTLAYPNQKCIRARSYKVFRSDPVKPEPARESLQYFLKNKHLEVLDVGNEETGRLLSSM